MSRQLEIDFSNINNSEIPLSGSVQDLLSMPTQSIGQFDHENTLKTAKNKDQRRFPYAALKASVHKVSNVILGR